MHCIDIWIFIHRPVVLQRREDELILSHEYVANIYLVDSKNMCIKQKPKLISIEHIMVIMLSRNIDASYDTRVKQKILPYV
jgi:hypothetical protein